MSLKKTPSRRRRQPNTMPAPAEVLEQRALLSCHGLDDVAPVDESERSADPDASAESSEYRSIDGTGNNLANPEWGSSDTALVRLVGADYADGLSSPSGDDRPSAREVSNAIAAVDEAETNERYLTDLLWMWGQFVDHDIDLTENATDEFGNPLESLPIEVPAGDLWFDPAGDGDATIAFNRSVYTEDEDGVRQQVNQITAFLDGSVVYGSDAERAAELRTFSGGLLRTSDGDLLPFNEAGLENAGGKSDTLFLAGDVRANENAALSAMHTIWVREHNRIATELAAEQPNLTDEELYQQARARVTAEIQVITFNEFLPALLGAGAVSEYTGYDASVNPAISNVFSTAAYRLGHSLLSSELLRIDESGEVIAAGNLPLQSAFFSPDALIDHGVDSLLRGASANVAQELDNQVVDDIRNFLFGQPGSGGFDLASLNIQRGRDHGLPDYNQARIDLGLEPIESFSELTSDPELAAALESVYGDVNQIDVWVGGLAEDHLPGSSAGELFTTVIVDQFERLRDGDRFWYENLYSGQELAELEATTLADVIERNTGITGLQDNVFFAPEVFVVDLDDYDVADVKVTTQGDELRIVDSERGRVVTSRSLEDVSRLVITSARVTPHTIEVAGLDESQLPNGIVIDTGQGTRDTLILQGSRSSDSARVDADEIEFNGVVIEHVGIERVNLADFGRNDSFEVTPEAEEALEVQYGRERHSHRHRSDHDSRNTRHHQNSERHRADRVSHDVSTRTGNRYGHAERAPLALGWFDENALAFEELLRFLDTRR